jgi:hypothetical protein
MSDDLYLIAHKVRGEPAFDIAQHMTCPACEGTDDHCVSCDGAGHWWIIPTSGHRAWPYYSTRLDDVLIECAGQYESVTYSIDEMPSDLRDHYTTVAEAALDLTKALGLTAKPSPPVVRRM